MEGKSIFLPAHTLRSQPLFMQIIPAECRYMGLFVMVEVYHSGSASHELMMNGRRERWREREQRAAVARMIEGQESKSAITDY